MEDMIGDSANSLSKQDEKQDMIGFDLEVCLFCEQICEKIKELQRLFPTITEEEKQRQIPVLQSISDNISRFCVAHGQPATELEEGQATTELNAGLDTDLDEGQAAMESQSTEAEEREQDRLEVEGEAMAGRGKIEAGLGGEEIPTETEEAPWFDIYHKGKSVTEMGEEEFAAYRRCWERQWGNGKSKSFEDLSLLSPMMFTHRTPGCRSIGAVVGRTFQVYSVKIAEIKGVQWPLKVYGVISARDDVDKHRNPLFLRSRTDYQIVDQKDAFLQLTGPCRAIVSEEPIEIEIQLRVNRGKKSDDRPLISDVFYYNGDMANPLRSSSKIDNHLCEIELSYQQLKESVQATLFGFHVGDPSPFDFGVKIVCSSLPQGSDVIEPEVRQVVLFDSRCGKVPMGNLKLSRQVVSVELKGKLRILIQSYASSGGIAAHGSVFITPQDCHTSQHVCYIGGSEVKFTIAWSLLLADKTIMLMDGYVDPYEDLPPFDPSVLEMLGISE